MSIKSDSRGSQDLTYEYMKVELIAVLPPRRWMKLRKIDLLTADGLPPLPMQISWVRDGILVVGMDSEMHVYSQWKPDINKLRERGLALLHQESDEVQDTRNLRDEDLRTLAQETSQRRLATVSSMPHLSRVSSINLTMLDSKKKRGRLTAFIFLTPHLRELDSLNNLVAGAIVQADQISSADYMTDYGLFEASRIACPVLPQYHPKQLMELLNSGKIRWVKAILAHLVRCISGTCSVRQGTFQSGTDEESLVRQRGWSRSRTLSVSYVGAGIRTITIYRNFTRICLEGEWKTILETNLSTPDPDLNLDLLVIGSLVYCESIALDQATTETGTTSPLEQRGSTTAIPEELTLDYAEITSIPPLPLWTLLAADKETTGISVQMCDDHQDYNELFNGTIGAGDQSLDDILEDEPNSPGRRHDRRPSVNNERQGLSHFGPRQVSDRPHMLVVGHCRTLAGERSSSHGRLLSRLLTHTHLPGLSSLDQMHLLALADTVSTCNTDFAERFAIDAAKNAIAKENLSGMPEGEDMSTERTSRDTCLVLDSLDDCGLRFLMAMKHYNYLLRCLPIAQRTHFQRQGMGTNNVVWAFHSESEEELLGLIPSYAKGSPKWAMLKELGVGWWLRNHTMLKTCIEKVAKASYLVNEDPMDAAIFYLAMKKKSLVWGLYRSKRDERMTHFFANNFSEDRWRKAALKNAYALLGKQRFEHAAAFFLLAGALRDAIEVCLDKLEDFQLAMVIARLYEGELDSTPASLKRLLYEEILGCNKDGENQDLSRAHPDPFLRSMALWILKDHTGSLNTLLQSNTGSMHPQYCDDDKGDGPAANPNVFNFYVYLRTHPLLIRQYIASTAQDKRKAHTVVLAGFSYGGDTKAANPDKQLLLEDSITPLERQLYFTTAHAHFKAGCPALALEVLSKLPGKVMDPTGEDSPSLLNSPTKARVQDMQIDTGILAWENDSTATAPSKSNDVLFPCIKSPLQRQSAGIRTLDHLVNAHKQWVAAGYDVSQRCTLVGEVPGFKQRRHRLASDEPLFATVNDVSQELFLRTSEQSEHLVQLLYGLVVGVAEYVVSVGRTAEYRHTRGAQLLEPVYVLLVHRFGQVVDKESLEHARHDQTEQEASSKQDPVMKPHRSLWDGVDCKHAQRDDAYLIGGDWYDKFNLFCTVVLHKARVERYIDPPCCDICQTTNHLACARSKPKEAVLLLFVQLRREIEESG
uniref:RAVE complex protein Rav1 C-terminal domain-containing protein n=2 Tax=Timema TaxID=61471 RepID=A0A7R9E2C9_9NEOP|nr:unnamed protein product [Timema monikensis]